jgi:hypothetical protein
MSSPALLAMRLLPAKGLVGGLLHHLASDPPAVVLKVGVNYQPTR